MASGGGGIGGAGVCNKRYRRSADDDGETIGRNKRCVVGLTSGANDDGERGDFYGGGHALETADDDDGAGEDYIYGYDDEEADERSDGDAAAAAASACDTAEQRYVVLTEADVRARQEADTAKVAEVLSIPMGFAAVLLRHFKWRVARVQEEWFTDERRVRGAVGLPAPDGDGDEQLVPHARSPRPQVCGICFDAYPAGRTRSAGCCSHYYCDGCWRGYVAAAVSDGARCLSLRCPHPSCSAPVVRELVDAVLLPGAADSRARYARFWLRSYVEESGGRIKWCGGAGCTRSVELLAGDAADVFCSGCRHGFCWRCGEEAHGPVSCGTVRAWLAKNASDSETANWVVAHTKRCPKCRRPIEKNHGCNHMTCGAPCRHQFCWLCFDPWDNHRGCSARGYDDDYRRHRQQGILSAATAVAAAAAADEEEEARRRQAKASLDRYLYHYERWAGNGKSLQKALADADELERSGLERMARTVDVPAMDLGFVTEAYRQIADGRRVLRWAHAYAYFLFLNPADRDAAKRDLFDDLQSQANRWLECLHSCAELDRKLLFGGGAAGGADGDGDAGESITTVAAEAFRAYKEKLANLTGVTRKFMGNLVKAFKTNLPEVVVTPAFGFHHIVNGTTRRSQTAAVGGTISTATVTLEPPAMLPMVSRLAAGFWQMAPIPSVTSQGRSTLQRPSLSSLISQETDIVASGSVQQHSLIRNPVHQPFGPGSGGHGSLPSNPLQFPPMNSSFFREATTSTGPPNVGAITPLQFHISNMISNGATSTPPVAFSLSGPGQPIGTETMMVQSTALGSFGSNTSTWNNSDIAESSSQPNSMGMNLQAGINPLSSAMNVPIRLDPNAQQPPKKYVKIWEGTLFGQRQGQPVLICKLECYSGTTSKTVAADWPETMQIVRLIAQEHMNNKQYVGKADFLVFRTLNQHGFLGQLQEKKLCAVIQLPSQTLLLSMSDKENRMIGMIFPKNMVIFKQEVLTQLSQVQQEKPQQQEELHHQQLQLLQQQQSQQQQNLHRLQQQILQKQQMQQMQHQQHMGASTQNLPTQEQKQQQQKLQHQEQLGLQQQLIQHMQQQHLRQQMQHQQQLRQQIQQLRHQQQHMQQMQPQ